MQKNDRTQLNNNLLLEGILNRDRILLARAITLIESNLPAHFEQAQQLLTAILPHSGNSIRIGITGVPGAGKSTLVESLGGHIIKEGHRVAVLAIDPSSSKSGGSILGDKTRMEKLSQNTDAFIRPSPSAGTLGGVARKTRESILLCEAAGYDVIIVETMGVGQGEIAVRSMVDFFLLVQITGAGDELQGIKKGIIEMADAIVINKADGDNVKKAITAKRELRLAVHYLGMSIPGWEVPVFTCSALTGDGIDNIWKTINRFREKTGDGYLKDLRKKQDIEWMHSVIDENIRSFVLNNEDLKEHIAELEQKVLAEKVTAGRAALEIVDKLRDKFRKSNS